MVVIYWLFKWLSPGVANRGFRLGQLASGTFVAFTHGANDAQKTMGVIALALFTHGSISSFYIPTWVKVAAGVAIGAGTYVGGWRIMRTIGQRMYRMEPENGFVATDDRRRDDLPRDASRLPALDDARHLGVRDGRRRDAAAFGGPLGPRRQHRRRVDPDDPGCGARRRGRLLAHPGHLLNRQAPGTVPGACLERACPGLALLHLPERLVRRAQHLRRDL